MLKFGRLLASIAEGLARFLETVPTVDRGRVSPLRLMLKLMLKLVLVLILLLILLLVSNYKGGLC